MRSRALWWGTTLLLISLVVVGRLPAVTSNTWAGPEVLFWTIVVGAGLCWLGGVAVLVAGWRARQGEVALLGTILAVQSSFGVVHGLTAPGVVYPSTSAVTVSVVLGLPAAMLSALPLLAPALSLSRALLRHWRGWVLGWMVGSAVACAVLLVSPDALRPPATPGLWLIGCVSLAATVVLSRRQLWLYDVGTSPACLWASLALMWLAFSSITWIGTPAFSPTWWAAHALDVLGVLAADVAILTGYQTRRSLTETLAPVTTRDPLVALALGIDPVIARYIGALQDKDQITCEHVVRVAETAMRLGERLHLPARQLRNLGLAALLHDVGKLAIPDEILTKPGSLNDSEMAIMRTHADAGADLLEKNILLAPIAPIVRAHHERIDGAGYPAGLRADQIPFEARVVAVCDAYDAMAHTRQYRAGLGQDRALGILRQHAGQQWDSATVEALAALVADGVPTGQILGGTDCLDCIPAQAGL